MVCAGTINVGSYGMNSFFYYGYKVKPNIKKKNMKNLYSHKSIDFA